MPRQDHASFGDALKAVLRTTGRKQAELARKLQIDPGQVSRWATNKQRPHVTTVLRIDEILGSNLVEAFNALTPDYEIYVSAPITGLDPAAIGQHHDDVARVVDALSSHVNNVYWPGRDIRSLDDLVAPDIATERNLQILSECSAHLYLQFAQVSRPTSALVEFGFALGRRLKTTFILKNGLSTPFMLEGFQGVASSLAFLPKTHVYPVSTVDDAIILIARNGRELFGLGPA